MNIASLIDTDYSCVSILENMEQVAVWLKDVWYVVVIDENRQAAGVVTSRDVCQNFHCQIIDSDIAKLAVSPDQSIDEVLLLMNATFSLFLPVYDNKTFAGVISLFAITKYLITLNQSL